MQIEDSEYLIITLLFLFLTNLVVDYNIPILRQITGFIFLAIIPGMLILRFIDAKAMNVLEKGVLSIGTSIAFLLVFSLLFNNLALFYRIPKPLEVQPIILSLTLIYIVLLLLGRTRGTKIHIELNKSVFTSTEKFFLATLVLFPALSIFGTHVLNTTDNNIFIIILLLLVPSFVVAVCIFNKSLNTRMYPLAILFISISLQLLLALRSNHIIGNDAHIEFYIYMLTQTNYHWALFEPNVLNSCLSISLLPAIFHAVLGIPPEMLFKTLFSVLFSVVPLVIFLIARNYLEDIFAFIAACFFMFQPQFLQTAANARTYIAIMFFAMFILVLVQRDLEQPKKRLLFLMLLAASVLSHYSTTYIIFGILLGTWFLTSLLKTRYNLEKLITLDIILIFFVFIYLWYSVVTVLPWKNMVEFLIAISDNIGGFLLPSARGSDINALFGDHIGMRKLPYYIQFLSTWLTLGFVGLGILDLLINFKKRAIIGMHDQKVDFQKNKFNTTYAVMSIICIVILILVVTLPGISVRYEAERVYPLVLIILATFFITGAHLFTSLIHRFSQVPRKNVLMIILIILVPYFLASSGIAYTFYGISRDIHLHSEGIQYEMKYTHDSESFTAQWLQMHMDSNYMISADPIGIYRLESQGLIRSNQTQQLFTDLNLKGYYYLRYSNIIYGNVVNRRGYYQSIREYPHLLNNQIKISSNGKSVILLNSQ